MLARVLQRSRDSRSHTSALQRRICELEAEIAVLRKPSDELIDRLRRTIRLADTSLTRLITEVSGTADSALSIGRAVEGFASAMRARTPRGRAGGLARAQTAWRYSDGTFMPQRARAAAIEELEKQDYERYAAGGRARAMNAPRAPNGTFVRRQDGSREGPLM